MHLEPRLDIIGAALADPSRSRMLCELMDGRAFTNKELACAAQISPQTASGHLRQLEGAGLTVSLRSGRHVYHRIANHEVARILETLAGLSPIDHLSRGQRSASSHHLARCCYNHLAGRLGVLITERLVTLNVLSLHEDSLSPGPAYSDFMRNLGMAPPRPSSGKPVAKHCLDWTERRHHLSGPFANALLQTCLDEHWLMRQQGSRSLIITNEGWQAFHRWFGIDRMHFEP